MDRMVLEAVARADILISSVPWRNIGLSLLVALAVYIVGMAVIGRGR
jgi:hypothetical protein